MANTFPARRAPGVSQYLHNLNTVPSPHDLAVQQTTDLSLGDDGLDFLTNAEFFDFDALNVDFHAQQAAGHERGQQDGAQQYQFQTYPPSMTGSPSSMHSFQGHYAGPPPPPASAALQSYPPHGHSSSSAGPGDRRASATTSPTSTTTLGPPADLEEQSRMAAEEDKRRRNTAASARFRVKKKQREQALEKQAREMSEKVQMLEGKVQQLQMENKWLKGLITDKHDGSKVPDEVATAAAAARRAAVGDEEVDRSTEDRKDGVGTRGGLKEEA